MASKTKCGGCGIEFDAAATGGLCPDCLGRALFATGISDPEDESLDDTSLMGLPGESEAAEVEGRRGTRFGDYELLGEVARGGMGVVYKARQVSLNRIVAVKMIRSDQLAQEEDVQRFHTEAEAAAKLRHQNIVAIHDVGEHEGRSFYSMDYVEGKSLAHFRLEKGLPVARAVAYVKSVAQAIHYAHQRGILHRDLKPSNVLIDADDQVRVADFGLAKVMTAASELTMSGTVMGSPSYMPPEQAEGRVREVTVRSDVYSLGAILYELLSGRPPFKGESVLDTLKQVVETDVVAPSSFNARIPSDLETICLKCLDKEPSRRYGSAQELADELDRFQNDLPIAARRSTQLERLWRWCRRKPIVAGLGAVTVLLVLTVAIGSPIAALRLDRARQEAETNLHLAEAREVALREYSYANEMRVAAEEIAARDPALAVRVLERSVPAAGEKDYRSWEWYFLWDQCRSDEEFTLGILGSEVFRLAFTEGNRVVTGDFGATVRLWDLPSRQLLAEQKLMNISDLEVSPDGTRLAAAYWAGDFSFLDPATLETQAQHHLGSKIYDLAFSPRADLLATAGPDHVAVWRLSGTEASRAWRNEERDVEAIAFSPRENLLAFATVAGRIQLVDTLRGKSQGEWTGSLKEPWELSFSPDGSVLAVTYMSGPVVIYDPARFRQLAVLTNHTKFVASLAFSPSAPVLATSSADSSIKLWDTRTWEELATFKGHSNLVNCVRFSLDGSRLVSAGKDKAVKVWDPAREPKVNVFPDFAEARAGYKLSAQGEFLAVPRGGELLVWDTAARQVERRCAIEPGTTVVAISQQGTRAILVTPAERAILRHLDEGEPSVDLGSALADRAVAEFSPRGTWYVLGGQDTRLKAGRTEGSEGWWEMDHPIDVPTGMVFGKEENWVITSSHSGKIRVCDVERGVMLEEWAAHGHVVEGLAVSSDGKMLATASKDGTVGLWDLGLEHRKPVKEFGESAIGFRSVSFTRDGARLIASDDDGGVKMWAIDSGREVARFSSREVMTVVRFCRDDQTLVIGKNERVDLYWAPRTFDTVAE